MDEPEQGVQTFPEMTSLEQILSDFAELLPKALTDPSLAKIVWDEAKANEEYEAYALWSKIADIHSTSGITLRSKIQNIKMNRTRGKATADVQSFTSVLDEVEYLQVYIHNFEDWDSKTILPTTYTPLTIDDMDVTELLVYDSLGYSTFLDVSDNEWEPDYPIAIISINEGIIAGVLNSAMMKTINSATLAIYLEKITVRRPRSLEPWYKGHADMVVAQKDESSTGYIYKVNNPAGQTCHSIKSKTAIKKIDDGSSTNIKVYEFDLGGWPEWIIKDANLFNVTTGGGWSMTVIDKGKYYMCSHHVRCDYNFKLY